MSAPHVELLDQLREPAAARRAFAGVQLHHGPLEHGVVSQQRARVLGDQLAIGCRRGGRVVQVVTVDLRDRELCARERGQSVAAHHRRGVVAPRELLQATDGFPRASGLACQLRQSQQRLVPSVPLRVGVFAHDTLERGLGQRRLPELAREAGARHQDVVVQVGASRAREQLGEASQGLLVPCAAPVHQ